MQRSEICYRVENNDGEGMYCGITGTDDVLSQLTNANADNWDVTKTRHPIPSADRLLGPEWEKLAGQYRKYSFGFASLAQLRNWLYTKEVLEDLKERGFSIHLYETTVYIIGDTQMCFRKDHAREIGTMELI